MSEPAPGSDPLSEDQLRELEQALRQVGVPSVAIETITAIHFQWYEEWQKRGFPEHRAAEFVTVMIRGMFSQG